MVMQNLKYIPQQKNCSALHNKALHRTAIPLRSIASGELGR
jgi:hypothetical protein